MPLTDRFCLHIVQSKLWQKLTCREEGLCRAASSICICVARIGACPACLACFRLARSLCASFRSCTSTDCFTQQAVRNTGTLCRGKRCSRQSTYQTSKLRSHDNKVTSHYSHEDQDCRLLQPFTQMFCNAECLGQQSEPKPTFHSCNKAFAPHSIKGPWIVLTCCGNLALLVSLPSSICTSATVCLAAWWACFWLASSCCPSSHLV